MTKTLTSDSASLATIRNTSPELDQSRAVSDSVDAENIQPKQSWFKKLKDRDNINRVIVVLLFIVVAILVLNLIQTAALIIIPITFALLLNTLFYPVVRYCKRFNIPAAISAAIVMGVLVSTFSWLVVILMEPAAQWIRELPSVLQQFRVQLGSLDGPLSDIQAVSNEIEELVKLDGESGAIAVQIEESTMAKDFIVDQFPIIMSSIGIVVFLTYFLLASGDQMLKKLVRMGPSFSAKRKIVGTSYRIRKNVARYLATVTVINTMLAVVVTIAMQILGVSNPLLWGLLAGTMNFAPYVGPAVTAMILTLVGISEFSDLGSAMAVPLVFLGITIIEGQLITPAIVGRSLSLSPAGVFLSVVVWGWIWGVPGALMAVPIVATLKIIFENIPSLENLAMVLEKPKQNLVKT